jgi:hypothetical protein
VNVVRSSRHDVHAQAGPVRGEHKLASPQPTCRALWACSVLVNLFRLADAMSRMRAGRKAIDSLT